MQIRIHASRLEMPPGAANKIERRLRSVLGRHTPAIDRALVTVSGADSAQCRCQIRVRLRHGDSLAVEDDAEDLQTAVLSAAQRLGRQLNRQHEVDRLAERRVGRA